MTIPSNAADDVHGAFRRVVEGVVQRHFPDAEHRQAVDALKLEAGDEDLETTRDDFEIDEFTTAGFGEFEHLMAVERAVHDHHHVRTGGAENRAETLVGTKHRNFIRRQDFEGDTAAARWRR